MSNLLKDLDENCEQISQPQDLKVQLKMHQLTSIYKMNYLETNNLVITQNHEVLSTLHNYNDYINKTDNFNINILQTKIGILADKVGAGKTYIILGLISYNNQITENDKYRINTLNTININTRNNLQENSYYLHSTINRTVNNVYVKQDIINDYSENLIQTSANLIIVPFNLYSQWSSSIRNTNLVSYEINKSTKVHSLDAEDLNKYDIILITNTMYYSFVYKFQDIVFNRKIIDEVNIITFPKLYNRDIINAKFTWLISATPEYFNRNHRRYHKDILYHIPYDFMSDVYEYTYAVQTNTSITNEKQLRGSYIIVRNKPEYIDQSIILPDIIYKSHICPTPKELNVVKDYLEPELINMLNAGNYKDALMVLGCDTGDSDNIFNVLTNNIKQTIIQLKDKISNYENSLKTPEDLEPEQIYYIKKQIKEKKELLTRQETKYNSLNERIKKFYKENCVICMDDLDYKNYPSITPCCNQLICFDCLIDVKKSNKTLKCPLCRTMFNLKDVCVLSNDKKEVNIDNVQKEKLNSKKMRVFTKLDILNKILIENPDGKFLIFSEHDESFVKIITLLQTLNLQYREMKGNGLVINKIIENFNSGKIRILLLNTRHMGSGLNLQSCSDILLFHRQRPDLEKQLIGRGQRLGRTTSLKVHYLLHDNEPYLEQSDKINYIEIEDK